MIAMLRAASRATVAAAIVSLAVNPSLAAAQAVGVNAAVRNQVSIRSPGAARVRPAAPRERVVLNDQVTTGPASHLQILLLDRSTFSVGSNARLTIDRFVYDPNRNTRQVGASATRGAFRFMSGRPLRQGSGAVSVRTPVASIGVRGTMFDGVVGGDALGIAAAEPALAGAGGDPETATLIILRGPGAATQGNVRPGAITIDAGGRSILLDRPGLALYVPGPGLAPIGPFEISQAGLRSVQLLLRPAPPFLFAGPGPNRPPLGDRSGGDRGTDGDRGGGWLLPGLAAALVAVIAALVVGGGDGDEPPVSPG